MKAYKVFLKEEVFKRVPAPNIVSPILISEKELDLLIEGGTVFKEDESGNTYQIEYRDLKMIITFD